MVNKRKIYFRADADKSIGFGHFVRSLALADMVKDEFDCIFFTQTPTEYQKEEISKVCKLVELPADETKFSLFLDRLYGDEIIILDNYFFSSDYQKQVKDRGCKLVCLGSNDRHYYSDILINYTDLTPEQFSVEDYTKICLGIEWTLLRRPFWLEEIVYRSIPEKVNSIAVCFGGTDQFAITEKVIEYLQSYFMDVEIHVIATDSFGCDRIVRLSQSGIIVHVNVPADTIVSVFKSIDIAVLSASSIVQEALALQTPVIAGYYVENQLGLYNTLKNGNYIFGVGNLLEALAIEQIGDCISRIPVEQVHKTLLNVSDLRKKYIKLFKAL